MFYWFDLIWFTDVMSHLTNHTDKTKLKLDKEVGGECFLEAFEFKVVDWLIDWFDVILCNAMHQWVNEWMNECVLEMFEFKMVDWLIDWFDVIWCDVMHEWMNEMNEWMTLMN